MYPPQQKPPDLDLAGRPVETKPPDLDITGKPTDSMLSRGWKAISEPLWEGPSRFGRSVADWITQPSLTETGEDGVTDTLKRIAAMTRGFAGGAVEGLGDLVSGFTSPVNLATMGLTGGSSIAARAGLPAIARALSIGGKVAAAPMIAHGAGEVLSPESSLAERGFGLAEMAGGGAAMFHSPSAKPKPTTELTERPVAKQGEVMPTMDDVYAAADENTITPKQLQVLRMEVFSRASNEEIIDAANQINQTRKIRWRSGAPPIASELQDARIIEMEIKNRGLNAKIEPDPTISRTREESQAINKAYLESKDRANFDPNTIVKPKLIGQEPDLNFKTKEGRTIKELIDTNRFYREKVKSLRERAKGELSGTGPIHQALEQAEKAAKAAGIKLSAGKKEAINAMKPEITTFTGETEGPVRIVRKEKIKSPLETVREALKQGYVFIGKNDIGDMRFQKAKVPPGESMPILEEQVGTARPTAARAARQEQTPFDAEFGMRGEPPNRPPTGPTEPPIPEGPERVGPLADVKRNPLAEAYNFGRGTMASWDLSAPLRQGLPLIHRKEFWTSLKPMIESLGSEEAFRASQRGIAERALFRPRIGPRGKQLPSFAEDAGLKLTDLTDLTKREEALMSTWAEKIPGVRASNRAYTTFLNKLRADTFESLIRDAKVFGVDGEANLPVARALAEFINNATGRGSLKFRVGLKEGRFGGDYGLNVNLERHAVLLNSTLFAPRLIASRLRMMDPRLYIFGNPVVRKEALKSLASIAGIGNTLGQLVKMAGGDVNTDPNNADFGKIKIGNVRIDPYAGFQQYVVAFNRLVRPSGARIPGLEGGTDTGIVPFDVLTGWLGQGGQSTTSSTTGKEYDLWNPSPGPYDPNSLTIGGRFLRGKMHPVVGFAWSLLSGKTELSGEKMNFTTMNPMDNSIMQRFIPILMQDVYELAKTDPRLLPLAIPATFGMGIQSYNWMK